VDRRAPAAGGVGDDLLVLGDFERIRAYRLPGMDPLGDVPGRAYAVTPAEDEVWIATADELVRLDRDGRLLGRRSFRER
jgi:hypothetical protein